MIEPRWWQAEPKSWELRTPVVYGSEHAGFYRTLKFAQARAKELGYPRTQVIDKVVYAEDDDD